MSTFSFTGLTAGTWSDSNFLQDTTHFDGPKVVTETANGSLTALGFNSGASISRAMLTGRTWGTTLSGTITVNGVGAHAVTDDEADVAVVIASGAGQWFGYYLLCRNGFQALVRQDDATGVPGQSGTHTTLGTSSSAMAESDQFTLSYNKTTGALTAQQNGTTIISATDTTYNAQSLTVAMVLDDNNHGGTGISQLVTTGDSTGGAALAGGAAAAEAATGALSTQIKVGGGASASAGATGALSTGSGFAGGATASSSATGALKTGAGFSGSVTELTNGAAALTNFATVVLTSPPYTGVGSILDPNANWSAGAPGVGATVYYDGQYITIDPDGEIVSTTNTCTALVQFYNGTTWSQLVVVLTPGLVGYVAVASAATGAFSTAASLVGAASALVSVAGTLTTAVQLVGGAAGLSAATAALNTAIRVAGTAISVSTAAGSFTAGAAVLAGAPVSSVSASGALSTVVQLTAASVAVLQAAGALATRITLAANALASTSASGSLSSGVTLNGAAVDAGAASASILTQIRLSGAATDINQAAGALSAQIELVGNAIQTTVGTADLSLSNPLAGAPTAVATATASLLTLINMSGLAWTSAAVQGALATNVVLAPAAIVNTLATGRLFTVPTITPPNALADIRVVYAPSQGDPGYTQVGDQPYGEFYQAPGEVIWYAINWSEWLANRWQPDTNVTIGQSIRPYPGNGYQETCTIAGRTGGNQPQFVAATGASVMDGGVEWVTTPVDDTSLGATVVTAFWTSNDQLALSSGGVQDQRALVLIDTTNAISGVDYDALCTATMTDGQINKGTIRVKVR